MSQPEITEMNHVLGQCGTESYGSKIANSRGNNFITEEDDRPSARLGRARRETR